MTDFTRTEAALAEYDASADARDDAWRQEDADADALHAMELNAIDKVREAFALDTAEFNPRDRAMIADTHFMRECVYKFKAAKKYEYGTMEHASEASALYWEYMARAELQQIAWATRVGLGSVAAYKARAQNYADVAKALRLKIETGVEHCVCHLRPMSEHRKEEPK